MGDYNHSQASPSCMLGGFESSTDNPCFLERQNIYLFSQGILDERKGEKKEKAFMNCRLYLYFDFIFSKFRFSVFFY
jgi:hypothetical protein